MKPANIRPLAEDDLVHRTRYYVDTGGRELAIPFFDAAMEAVRSAEQMPGIGSPTVGELIGIAELRRIGVEGFSYSWFYMERADHLDVIRLLADSQDLENLLGNVH